jgi:hypothetical protein
MSDLASEAMRLQTIADYWVRATFGDYTMARGCAWNQAEEEGLRFDRKQINAAMRRAWNRLPDAEREELYLTVARPDLQATDEEDLPLRSFAMNCHQDQDHDEDEDEDHDQDQYGSPNGKGSHAQLPPGSATPREDGALSHETPEVYDLLERHRLGLLSPVPVCLGAMPPHASDSMRQVADDIALLVGLRLAVDEDRPLMYSTSFCAWRMGWQLASGDPDKRRASRVINKLIDAGVIELAGEMPRTGTRLLTQPSPATLAGAAPESPAVTADRSVKPLGEVSEQAVVHQAQPVLREDLGVVATRHGAAARAHRSNSDAGREVHSPGIPALHQT